VLSAVTSTLLNVVGSKAYHEISSLINYSSAVASVVVDSSNLLVPESAVVSPASG
jgi:hypothetical protein